MANRNNISKATPSAILGKTPVPCHQYDNWLLPEISKNRDAVFAASVLDVSRGTKAIASILTTHLIDLQAIHDGDTASRTLLNVGDTEALARLAVFSLSKLHEMAVDHVDHLNAGASKEMQS